MSANERINAALRRAASGSTEREPRQDEDAEPQAPPPADIDAAVRSDVTTRPDMNSLIRRAAGFEFWR